MRVLITGTPGTGKTTISKALARQLNYPYLDVKKIINQEKLFYRKKEEKEKTVYLDKLQKKLKNILSGKKNAVIESHLLCEFSLPIEAVVVLRCDPVVLERRLKKRGYSRKKIHENIMAEALDYCTQRSEQHYSKVIEVNATRHITPMALKEKIRHGHGDNVDWSQWLYQHV